MSPERNICIFSLSRRDPNFRSVVSINGPINWLNGKKNPPHRYFFGSIKPRLACGSKVLFSFENQIFGEASIKEEIQQLKPTDEEVPETFHAYKNFVTLDPNRIKIYRFHPTKSELMENEKFENYQFSQLFSYLSPEQYEEILKIAER